MEIKISITAHHNGRFEFKVGTCFFSSQPESRLLWLCTLAQPTLVGPL